MIGGGNGDVHQTLLVKVNVGKRINEFKNRKQGFDKFFGADTEAFVTCKVRKGVKIIEITVNYGGTTFRTL